MTVICLTMPRRAKDARPRRSPYFGKAGNALTALTLAALLPLAAPPARAQSWTEDYASESASGTKTLSMFGPHIQAVSDSSPIFDPAWDGYLGPEFGCNGYDQALAKTEWTQTLVFKWEDGDGNPAPDPPAKAYFLEDGRASAYFSVDTNNQTQYPASVISSELGGMQDVDADDGLGDKPFPTYDFNPDYSNGSTGKVSSGRHLVQKDGSSGVVSFTVSGSAGASGRHVNEGGPYPDLTDWLEVGFDHLYITTDTRAVTISSSLGQTYHKGPPDHYGVSQPEADVPAEDGTINATSVKYPDCPYDVTYSAIPVGSWAAASSYHWSLKKGEGLGYHDGTFTLPGDPPYNYDGRYNTSDETNAPEHAYIHLTDASDGAEATANYYINWHDILENIQDVGSRTEIEPTLYGTSDGSQPANGQVNVRIAPDQIDWSVADHVGGGVLTVGGAVIAVLQPETSPWVIAFLAGSGYTLGLVPPPDPTIYMRQGTEGQFTSDLNTELQIASGNTDGVFMPSAPRMDPNLAHAIAASGNYHGYFTGEVGNTPYFGVQVYTGPIHGSITKPGSIEYVYHWQ